MADLGRYQRGGVLGLGLVTPAIPDAPPVATIVGPSAEVVAALELPFVAGVAPAVSFFRPTRIGAWPNLGSYQVTYTYSVAGVGASASDTFELVAGGDSGGAVISLHWYERPEASYVVAQLSSGKLVQGRNPYL